MTPTLYSFRRCPYAMRARLALASSGQQVKLREVVLRDKPSAFLDVSPSATVPCLVIADGAIDESLDIMTWSLRQSDPEGWLDMPAAGWDWIERADGPFKDALDHTKYASRYPEMDASEQRDLAAEFLTDLDQQVGVWIFEKPSIADYAILPFVRQFAFIDKDWFDAQPWPDLQTWLDAFLTSDRFAAIMSKYPQWVEGNETVPFP
ncbi:glutathione S-transferase [Parasedimentitalea maritima]|uniref:Glutathione S-transferase n=1 Tax=Parasedimentitalea maritima TaxID=2578117 RepID=A0A6A4RJQ3_9RHOB|nr:glutathione S-transferase [Zongyanglinia marina]KAE9631604.1 glutathione S-transferase [Zongyanglinia marina]